VDPRTARLEHACQLWGDIRYLHPWVVEGRVDWDAPLIAAAPKLLAAETDEASVAALTEMLAALHDSATRVERARIPSAPLAHEARVVDGITVVTLGAATWADAQAAGVRLGEAVHAAKAAVVDLRSSGGDGRWLVQTAIDAAASKLVSHEVTGLSLRRVEHRGYRPQSGITSGGYTTDLVSSLPMTYPADAGPHASRIVFVTNAASGVPDVAWAMQKRGDAAIVVQGALGADAFGGVSTVAIEDGFVAHVRHAELAGVAPRVDLELDAGTSNVRVIEAAVKMAKAPAVPRATQGKAATEPSAAWRLDATYADAPYPSAGQRLLALFRFFCVIHYFYPYLPLMGGTWDQAFRDLLPRFEHAADAHEYTMAVAALAARIPDGHVRVWGSKDLEPLYGASQLPVQARVVEGRVVITAVSDDSVTAASAIAIGDVVLAVDGEPIDVRRARIAALISAANETWRDFRAANLALRSSGSGPVVLSVENARGEKREVRLGHAPSGWKAKRTGPVFHLIDDAIGYADLDRLEIADVDAMLAAFANTRAIVLDMRGYPHGTAWVLAPRLHVNKASGAARFFEPLVASFGGDTSSFEQAIPPSAVPPYRGKTVMLIDERTMSQAEHTGLFLEAANGTRFVGSQTAGSNGDVTNLSLPGGLYVSFSGHDVRHADGRPLQRIGLVPDVEVRPTVSGLRAGRDEVLERAVELLRRGE
jgi:C-terminal processing protease CtpA/Prc